MGNVDQRHKCDKCGKRGVLPLHYVGAPRIRWICDLCHTSKRPFKAKRTVES